MAANPNLSAKQFAAAGAAAAVVVGGLAGLSHVGGSGVFSDPAFDQQVAVSSE